MGEQKRPQAWEVVREEHKGDFEIFQARALHVRSPQDGSEHTFHVADAPDAVTVIAVTEDEQLVMVRQWRHPLQRVTLETPSGIIEDGESPQEAAARELREETGYAGGEPRVIGCVVINPSWQTSRLYAVVIRGVSRAGEKELDEGEDTRVACVPVARIKQMVLEGEVDASPVVAALALWDWGQRNGPDGQEIQGS